MAAAIRASPARTPIEKPTRWRRQAPITFDAQKPESARITSGPRAPHRRTRPASSRTKRSAPRIVLAGPFRIRRWSTSPVSARVASSGW